MRSFYHYMMTYRGERQPNDQSKLADWMFYDDAFPKQSTNYGEISSYLEWNSPFPNALMVFDELWSKYQIYET